MLPIKHPSYHAVTHPQKIAYQMADSGEALTYAELDADSNRGAQLLRASGLVHGDHVAMLMENSLDFFRVAWSAQRSGIYYTAISTHLKADEIAYILTDCEAKVLFISSALIELLAEISHLPPGLRIVDADCR